MELSELAPEIFEVIKEGMKVDLTKLTFLGQDFRYQNFGDIDFDQCKFIQTKMSEASLWLARFGRCEFYIVDFSGTQLTPINQEAKLFSNVFYEKGALDVTTEGDKALSSFRGSRFKQVNFNGACMEEMNFSRIEFEDCNFCLAKAQGIEFKDSVLKQCLFNLADLTMVGFGGALLGRVKFIGARMTHGNFVGTVNTCVVFNKADCKYVTWGKSKHVHSRFKETDLMLSDFTDAELNYCDFRGANLANTKFENTSVHQCRWDGADFGNGINPHEWLEFLCHEKKIHAVDGGLGI